MNINKLKSELIAQRKSKFKGNIYHYSQVNFAYNSNKIEGSNFTIEDLQILFEKNIVQGTHWSYVNILDTKSQTFLCCTSS